MADEVVEVGALAAAADLEAQIEANSSQAMISSHILSNKVIGSVRPTKSLTFNCLFLEEPVLTTGHFVVTRVSEQGDNLVKADLGQIDITPIFIPRTRDVAAPERRGSGLDRGDHARGDVYNNYTAGPSETDVRAIFHLDPRHLDPIVSAGVTEWIKDGKGRYVGCNYYLSVFYPEIMTVHAMGVGTVAQEPSASVSAPQYRAEQEAEQKENARTAIPHDAAGAFPLINNEFSDAQYWRTVRGPSEVRHWLKFEAEAMYDLGSDVYSELVNSGGTLPGRMPGVGDAGGRSQTAPIDVLEERVRATQQIATHLEGNQAGGTPEYYAALVNVRNAQAMLANAKAAD